jgi:copper chaperone NosL
MSFNRSLACCLAVFAILLSGCDDPPEETRPVSILYVSAVDLGGWDNPEADPGNMIAATAAWFVIDSDQRGSMGAPETIPFSSEQAARAFAAEHGGTVLRLAEIPDSYILGS